MRIMATATVEQHPPSAPVTPGRRAQPAREAHVGLVVAILALAGISVSLMQTLVIPIVGQLPALLNASATDTTWAITATLLAAAVVTPIAGRLGDMVGKRPVLLASLVVMVAGSVVCAFSDSLTPMIVGRILQGFASGVIPLGISLMRDILPAEKLGPAVALMSASLGIGGALGLPAAALIAENADWHVLFWVAAGLGAVVFLLVLTCIPSGSVRVGGRLDVLGALGLSATLVALLLGVSKGEAWGWGSGKTVGLLAAAVILALVWGWWQLRTRQPLVDLRTTARPQVLLTNLASVMFGFSMFAMSLVIPQLVQLPEATGFGLGRSMLVAGLTMVPSGLVMMASAPVSAMVSRRYGPKVTLMIGALVVAVGYALGAVFMDAVWQLAVVTGVIGAGIGFAYGSMPALIMSAVPVSETAAANSFNTLVRSIGTSVSSAVAGAVLASSAVVLGGVSVPSQDGFRTILVIGSGAALLALLITAFLPKHVPGHAGADASRHGVTEAAEPHEEPRAWEDPEGDLLDTPPPGRLAIRGSVQRGPGYPLPGAQVTLADQSGRQVARAVTAADGSYTLPLEHGGTFLLIVAAAQLAPTAGLVAVGDTPVTRDITLAGRSAITGRVLRNDDHANSPVGVADALVTLTDAVGAVISSIRTGADGGYSFEQLSGGSFVLTAQSNQSRPLARGVEVAEAGVLACDLLLSGGSRLNGVVVAASDGRPVREATVTLIDDGGHVVAATTSDEAGAYGFDDLDAGRYTVTGAGYAPTVLDVVVEQEALTTVRISLTAPAPQLTSTGSSVVAPV
jgi:MFS family permease